MGTASEACLNDWNILFDSHLSLVVENHRRGVGHWTAFSLTPGLLQIEVGHGRKAVVIFVPVPILQGWHKIQQR